MKREKGSCLSSLYCCEDHFNIEQDTQNYMQYKIMTLEHRQRVTLHLKKGIVPYKFQCQKKDKSQAPPEREFALKRKRQALVEEALAEANQSKPGAETLGSSKPKINILQKPSSNTTVNTVENVHTPEQGGRAGSDASMQTLSNFNEQVNSSLTNNLHIEDSEKHTTMLQLNSHEDNALLLYVQSTETVSSNKRRINILRKPPRNTAITVGNIYCLEQGSNASMRALFNFNEEVNSSLPNNLHMEGNKKHTTVSQLLNHKDNALLPGVESTDTVNSNRRRINILRKPSRNTTIKVRNKYNLEQSKRESSNASINTLLNINEQVNSSLTSNLHIEDNDKHTTVNTQLKSEGDHLLVDVKIKVEEIDLSSESELMTMLSLPISNMIKEDDTNETIMMPRPIAYVPIKHESTSASVPLETEFMKMESVELSAPPSPECIPTSSLSLSEPSIACGFVKSEGSAPDSPPPTTESVPDSPSSTTDFKRDLPEPICGSELESDESDVEVLETSAGPRTVLMESEIPVHEEDTPLTDCKRHLNTCSDNQTSPPNSTDLYYYNFQWEALPEPPIPSELRRETFSNSNVGSKTIYDDPYDAFTAIWDRVIMEHIAIETNRYAQEVFNRMTLDHTIQSSNLYSKWCDTTTDEMYVYFAILLAMGNVVKSKIEEYWSTEPELFVTPGFDAHISFERFQMLSKCLHFNNNQNLRSLDLDMTDATLFKLAPIISHLNFKFQSLYKLRQNIAIDESLLQWNNWLNINQSLSNKVSRIDIKTCEVYEPQSGYLWRFEVHRTPVHKPQDPFEELEPAVVLRLVKDLENNGHTLWLNDFYNSPALARRLKGLGIDCVGTLRTNRQFVPIDLQNLTKANMSNDIKGYTSGDVDLMIWKNHNRISTISTYHGLNVIDDRGTIKPKLIHDYNTIMSELNKKDQILATYPIEKKCKIWYKRLFHRLLNASVLNSFVLLKCSSSSYTHCSFRLSLVRSLIDRHSLSSSKSPLSNISRDVMVAVISTHHLSEYPTESGSDVRIRHLCAVCRKQVSTKCPGCNKPVCMGCFVQLHS